MPDMGYGYEGALANARRDLREKRYSNALIGIREAMCSNMNSPEPHNLLGIYFELRGDVDSALQHYRAACVLDPSYAPSMNNLERLVMRRFAHEFAAADLGENPCCKTS